MDRIGNGNGTVVRRRAGVVAVGLVAALVAALGVVAAPAVAAKKPRSCSIVKVKDMAAVVGYTVVKTPDQGPAPADACSFDIAPEQSSGLLDGLGGIVVQYHTGPIAKGIYGAAKSGQEKVGAVYWDPASGIATVYRKGKLVGVSVSYYRTPGAVVPSEADEKAQSVAIAKLARKRL